MNQTAVLVVEEDSSQRRVLCETISLAGYDVLSSEDSHGAIEKINSQDIGLVVSNTSIQPMDGYRLLRKIKSLNPNLPTVLFSSSSDIRDAVQAIREGAEDYLVEPFDTQALIGIVNRTLMQARVDDCSLVAVDPRSTDLVELAKRVAKSDATVMITGESGTGKEIFARYMHRQSGRCEGPFVAINCAALPENMLEAILFGYEKGAFTGAYAAKQGKFEQAKGGTLLLDEVSEMDLGLQAKLLRVLQEKEVERLGGRKPIALNVRVLATSNRNLSQYVREGRFREDLYYRLNVFPLHLPALRHRPADILPLAHYFMERYGQTMQGTFIDPAAERLLLEYSWPGNVRELDNLIQRALILKRGDGIEVEDIRFEAEGSVDVHGNYDSRVQSGPGAGKLDDDLKSREQELILDALSSENGSRKQAAALLGISPRTLRYKLARLREAGVAIPN